MLFDIAADGLAYLVKKVEGLVPHLVEGEGGLAILQYADDSIFLLEDDLTSARNLKFILCLFEQLSGLKINFLKSDIYCLGAAPNNKERYGEIFTCKTGSLPLNYVGIPLVNSRLSSTPMYMLSFLKSS